MSNATAYKLYYSEDNQTWTLISDNITKTYYVYTQPWNTSYYYKVIAYNASGASADSNIVKVVTPEQSTSGGAGWSAGGIVIAYYAPFLWLGVVFVVVGILAIAYGKTSRKHKKWEGFGGWLFLLGVIIVLAAVFLPTLHLL